ASTAANWTPRSAAMAESAEVAALRHEIEQRFTGRPAIRIHRGVAWDHLLGDFEANMVTRRRSPGTIKGYRWALEDFLRFLTEEGVAGPAELQFEHVEAWQQALGRRVSPGSQRLAATAIRQFLRWGIRRRIGWSSELPEFVVDVEEKRKDPRPLEPEHLSRILAYYRPRQLNASIAHMRNRALFCYLLATAARVSEALQVTRNEAERAIIVQKGGTEKILEVGPSVLAMIQDYLNRRDDDNPYLWVTHTPGDDLGPRPLKADGVREIWKGLARKLGIPPFTTHQIRHTAATELIDADVDHLFAANYLGHHDLSTIQRYAKVRERQRRQARDVLEG